MSITVGRHGLVGGRNSRAGVGRCTDGACPPADALL